MANIKSAKKRVLVNETKRTNNLPKKSVMKSSIKNAVVNKNGEISANTRTKLDIIYVGANQIIPLRVEHGEIIDVAFVSEENKGNILR